MPDGDAFLLYSGKCVTLRLKLIVKYGGSEETVDRNDTTTT